MQISELMMFWISTTFSGVKMCFESSIWDWKVTPASFIFLLFLGNLLQHAGKISSSPFMRGLRTAVSFVAGYSYMFFLLHHQMLYDIFAPFAAKDPDAMMYGLMLANSFFLILAASLLLQGGTEHILSLPAKLKEKYRSA